MAKMPVYAGMVFGKTANGGADMPRLFSCLGAGSGAGARKNKAEKRAFAEKRKFGA